MTFSYVVEGCEGATVKMSEVNARTLAYGSSFRRWLGELWDDSHGLRATSASSHIKTEGMCIYPFADLYRNVMSSWPHCVSPSYQFGQLT